jgi:hypothetical protein
MFYLVDLNTDESFWWSSSLEEARSKALELANARGGMASVPIHEARDDGMVVCREHVKRTPVPYTGELARAYIGLGARVHRVPIDCACLSGDEPITDAFEWRIVEIEGSDSSKSGNEFMTCRCGSWQLIEGIPRKVMELSAIYGVPVPEGEGAPWST